MVDELEVASIMHKRLRVLAWKEPVEMDVRNFAEDDANAGRDEMVHGSDPSFHLHLSIHYHHGTSGLRTTGLNPSRHI